MKTRAVAAVAAAAAVVLFAGQSLASGSGPRLAPTAGGTPYAAALSHPKRDPYYPAKGTTTLDALHYGLDLTWDDVSRELSGIATVYFRTTRDEDEVSLDLDKALTVSSVDLDGTATPFSHTGNKLDITTGAITRNSRHTLVITYVGSPKSAKAPTTRSDIPALGWTTKKDGEAWALQEPFGAFTWYPVNDHPSDKAFYDITVHTKAAWRGVSNGELMSNTVASGERTMQWHLDAPAASYLITIDIGPYREHTQTGPHGLPLTYWIRPQNVGDLKAVRHTPALLSWLEARLGPYPFDRGGAVLAPNDSAEETETMVSIDPRVLDGGDLSDLLHEYSHQWYGDDVTPNNWPDLWMNESFAMYIQIRWEIAHHMATNASWRHTLNHEDQRLRTHDGPPGAYDRRKFASLNVYFCGARMLDRMYQKLGAKAFWRLLRDWPPTHRYGNVDRGEWIRYVDRETGHNYGPFIRHWLLAKKSPK